MFTSTQEAGVKLTTCYELGKTYADHDRFALVVGKYICHTGTTVLLELVGCGQSDSHEFTHRHDTPDYMDKMFQGKLVRLMGERCWDYRMQVWGYRWTIHSVNLWEQGMENAPADIKRMCGTNC